MFFYSDVIYTSEPVLLLSMVATTATSASKLPPSAIAVEVVSSGSTPAFGNPGEATLSVAAPKTCPLGEVFDDPRLPLLLPPPPPLLEPPLTVPEIVLTLSTLPETVPFVCDETAVSEESVPVTSEALAGLTPSEAKSNRSAKICVVCILVVIKVQ